jgi:hypothetical protein
MIGGEAANIWHPPSEPLVARQPDIGIHRQNLWWPGSQYLVSNITIFGFQYHNI